MNSNKRKTRLTREAAAVQIYLENAERSLAYTYKMIGYYQGRLPDNPAARTTHRLRLADRQRQEKHIDDLKRAIRTLQNKKGGA